MKSLTILLGSALLSLSVGCASAAKPPVETNEVLLSAEAWHPQEDGLRLPDAPATKPREEVSLGSLSPTKHTPGRGMLVNIGARK